MEYSVLSEKALRDTLAAASAGDILTIDGRICLSEPIALQNKSGLTFRGINNAALDYMKPVDGFTETVVNGVKAFVAEIPDEIAVKKPYAAFAADRTMLTRPKLPKNGYYRASGCEDFDLMTENQRSIEHTMYYKEGELPVMRYPEVAQVRAFHWWTDETCYIESIDSDKRLIRFQNPPAFTMRCENSRTEGARWYMDNVFEALSDPGEYFITPDCKKIYYIPKDGEQAETLHIDLSTSEKIMTLENCDGIVFQDIAFKGSDRDKLWLARHFSQAAVDVPAAVELFGCTNIEMKNCSFTDIGLTCIGIDKGGHDITVDHCVFNGIGGNPIHIAGRNLDKSDWNCTYPAGHYANHIPDDILHGIHVTNCEIGDYGRVYCNACGILLRYAYDCDLSYNHIHDGYYTGISVGWVWGYGPHATNHIRIEYNHIHDIGKCLLSDMGGIYTLGQQEGTVIRGNVVHDIEMDSYGGWGIYLDEGSSDILVEKNVSYDVSAQPFHQHYGSNNLLRLNIFAFGEGGALIVSRKEEHLGIILERNILVSDGTPIYAKAADQLHITDCMNLVWNYNGEPLSGSMNYDVYTRTYTFPDANKRTAEQMKEDGLFNGVIIADPMFKDPQKRDFTLADDSPAKMLGF